MAEPPLPQHGEGAVWPSTPLVYDVEAHAVTSPARPAVIDHRGTMTYRQLWETACRTATGLRRRGVRRGDVVLLQLPSVAEFVSSFLAVERIGGVVCPVLPAFDTAHLRQILNLARPRVVITVDRHRSHRPARIAAAASHEFGLEVFVLGQPLSCTSSLDILIQTAPEQLGDVPGPHDISELAFTSGTTGRPKGVVHSHATASAGILSTIRRQRIGPRDRVHVALPVGHNFGYFYGVRLALHAGATVVLQDRWDPERMLDLVSEQRVTVSLGPPTFLSDLQDCRPSWGNRLDSLRLFTCGGAKLEESLAEWAVAELPGRLSKAFGMTELGHSCATGPDSPDEKVIHTEGSPQPEMEMAILDHDGEPVPPGETAAVAFRGPFLFLGYAGGERASFDRRGYFRTGDLGYADDDGYLVVVGREKNVIVRGAEKIPVEPVEEAVRLYPRVEEAAVVGAPDDRLGERPVVCIVPVDDAPITLLDILEHLEVRGVPRVHWPEALISVDHLPMTETGKIARPELGRIAADSATFEEDRRA